MQVSRPVRRPPAALEPDLFAHAATSFASVSLRSSSPSLGGISSGAAPPNCSASSANASSSSSMSPSATMRGSSTASAFNSSRNISRAMRPARRVGKYSVTCASFSGLLRASKPSTSRPSTKAAITVRRKGAETGTLKTRMGFLIRDQAASWHGCMAGAISNWRETTSPHATLARNASSAAFTASGVPTCIHMPSSRSPNSRSCSLARSNILVSENSPDGAPANTEGDMIAAPA